MNTTTLGDTKFDAAHHRLKADNTTTKWSFAYNDLLTNAADGHDIDH